MPLGIDFADVTVRIGHRALLDRVSLGIRPGESVAVIGRSGAGKTTLLRLVNGLVMPSSGEVRIDGRTHGGTDLVALRRRTGYVVQGIGLFPHRNVFDNVATVPRLLEWGEDRVRDSVARTLARVRLPFDEYAARFPRTMSGGEQQRVGIARAIVFEPEVLLCDEPFGALDPVVRREQQELFLETQSERRATILFVTHDLAEALHVADRVVMVDGGRVITDAPAAELSRSDHPVVRSFVDAARIPVERS